MTWVAHRLALSLLLATAGLLPCSAVNAVARFQSTAIGTYIEHDVCDWVEFERGEVRLACTSVEHRR